MVGKSYKVLVVLLSLLVVGMTACDSSVGERPSQKGEGEATRRERAEKAPTPVETVRLASETTARAESAKFSMRIVTSGLPQQQGSPQNVTVTGEGSGDLVTGETEMVMQVPMFGQMEARYVGSMMYQKVPEPLAAQVPPGKEWIVIDYEKMMREEYGAGLSEMQGGAQGSLSDQLNYLRGVSDSVEKLGTEKVRGVPTTHYRADVDLEKAASEAPEARRAYEKMKKELRTGEIPTEVWIDGEGRVRRYEMTMPVVPPEGTASGGGEASTVVTTVEYYDFGTPVDVQPPPEDKTIPLEELMKQQNTVA